MLLLTIVPVVFADLLAENTCIITHAPVLRKDPPRSATGQIISGKKIVQVRVDAAPGFSVSVVERPRSGPVIDEFNGVIQLNTPAGNKQYALSALVAHGAAYAAVEYASLCLSNDKDTLILAFETAYTGASEAFVVVQRIGNSIHVHALPPASQGGLVVNTDTGQARVWSAVRGVEAVDCDACAKEYRVHLCNLGAELSCSATSERPIASPARFAGTRIQFERKSHSANARVGKEHGATVY